MKNVICTVLLLAFTAVIFSSCSSSGNSTSESSFSGGVFQSGTIRILSGSENKELAEILAECSEKTGVGIEMTCKGSVDIMNELKSGAADYDAVWPASSIWLSLGDEQHNELYSQIEAEKTGGGTDMYAAASKAIEIIAENYDVSAYSPAIIMMSDGQSVITNQRAFIDKYNSYGLDVPVFSIMFGDADDEQLNELAELTNARVFDGRSDLAAAFRSVKGYN
ncbi:MAG: VWA domain-containing protein [Ruminiclostridium sp.]